MQEKDKIEILKNDIEISEIVQKKADETLEMILSGNIKRENAKVIDMEKERKKPKRRFFETKRSKAAAILIAFACAGSVSAGAATYIKWSKGMETALNMSEREETRQWAEDNGTVHHLNEPVTQNGITITAVESAVDANTAKIIFKVDGFDFEDQEDPYEGTHVIFDRIDMGLAEFKVNAQGGFLSGGNDENGEPAEYLKENGSKYFEISFSKVNSSDESLVGKTAQVLFKNINKLNKEDGREETIAEGEWKFSFTLQGNDENKFIEKTCSEKLEYGDVEIKRIKLYQSSIEIDYDAPFTGDGHKSPQVWGIKLKNGEIIDVSMGGTDTYTQVTGQLNTIINPDEAEGIYFLNKEDIGGGEKEINDDNCYYVKMAEN